jgi:hypothetical protein
MDIFSINLTHNEIAFIRQCLELPSITGRDAKFLAGLQIKLEGELLQIEEILRNAEEEKQIALEAIIESEKKKTSSKK